MNKTSMVAALASVVEMVKGQMKHDTLKGFVRACYRVSFSRKAEQEKYFMHDSLVEAAEYIYNLESGMLLIAEELKEMTTEQKIQMAINLAHKHMFEMTTLNFNIDQVWDEIDAIYNSEREMVA